MQNRLGNLIRPPSKKSFFHQGFFAVKRRAVFILGATWKALVRGWRRDCVVGGMETRFQWRKAHSRTAKCEAFHVAPRLFFMFFVFDSIHDSATMHNLSPLIFHWTATTAKTENSSTTVKEMKILRKSDKIGQNRWFLDFSRALSGKSDSSDWNVRFFGLSKWFLTEKVAQVKKKLYLCTR